VGSKRFLKNGMRCPYCKNEINVKEVWLKKSLGEKMRDIFVYFSNLEALCLEENSEKREFNTNYKDGLFLFLSFVAFFLILIIGSIFIVYPDYKASGKIEDLIGWPLFFLFFGLIVLSFFLGFSYFGLRQEADELFKKGFFSIKCPYCKREFRHSL
jgi:hypothetical protein